jgi:uncharacterized protein DUF955
MRGPGSADRLAEQLLCRHGLALTPPVDIAALAAAMGVGEIRVGPLIEDGRLDVSPAGATITVRAGEPRQRTRFTIAHELGHLAVETGERITARRHSADRNGVERFCDDHAAGLLMPHSWVARTYADSSPQIEVAINLGRCADVSLSAAVLRLRWVLQWPHALLRWTRRDGEWRLAGTVGAPSAGRAAVRRGPTTGNVLDACLARSPGVPATIVLPLRVGGRDAELPMEVLARRDAAVAFGPVSGAIDHSRDD